jgi:hypothetical protein
MPIAPAELPPVLVLVEPELEPAVVLLVGKGDAAVSLLGMVDFSVGWIDKRRPRGRRH